MDRYSMKDIWHNCTCIVRWMSCNVKAEVKGQRRSVAYRLGERMTIPYWFGIGMLGGIALFFILEHTGVLYQWFDKWDE